ncbi:TauD/TfdA family dioxygenase [Streptomyces sp. NPDC057616]|uniref:TauD/TfdA family dioxygenase n=1 Tax=Streptomyces sp. NPDC057616 TaxID=3346183 RepID=UPI00369589DA
MAEPADTTTAPFTGPALWYGPDMTARQDGTLRLSAAHGAELRTAVRTTRARGATLLRMTVADFPLPTLAAELTRCAASLAEGPGFVLIRGIPADLLGGTQAGTVLRGIGQYLGRPVPQTADGRTLCHIPDTGEVPDDPAPPSTPAARAPVPFHTPESDLLGLLCLRPARSGGRTLLAGAAAVHNAVLAARPDLAGRLYGDHLFARPGEASGAHLVSPLVTRLASRHGDRPSMRYDRARLDAGSRPSRTGAADGVRATDDELYDLVEAAAASPAVRLELDLRPGDLLLLDNHVVLHARTAYEDHDAPEHGRHLLRLWLARDEDLRPPTRAGVVPRDVIHPGNLRPAQYACSARHGTPPPPRTHRDRSRTPRP